MALKDWKLIRRSYSQSVYEKENKVIVLEHKDRTDNIGRRDYWVVYGLGSLWHIPAREFSSRIKGFKYAKEYMRSH